MPVSKLAEMTWPEVRDLESDKKIAIRPVGALEAHGPHLPLATDVIIAEAMARAGAGRLAARGYAPVILPSLAYTSASFAEGFPGTITLAAATVTSTLVDIARSLARHGFTELVIANSHLDPGHIGSIVAAIDEIRSANLLRAIFPDITRRPWGSRLGNEFKSGACHAGQYESSIVMAERPELVRDDLRRSLEPNPTSLSEAIRAGRSGFEAAGGRDAYFGYPADASRGEGEEMIDVLGAILEEAVLDES